jgi:hypothetical protein
VAIKVAAGKINAVTGESWRPGLHREPQDYMVSPGQPWLDGFAVEKGVIRQFVAMPLGEGYSVEEQLTDKSEWGGLQISVVPLKADVWQTKRKIFEEQQKRRTERRAMFMEPLACYSMAPQMGLAAGGRMRQVIHSDPFTLQDWDFSAADRVFVTLVHAKDWKSVTGEAAPNQPPTAKEYSHAKLPWFEHYGKDQSALAGSLTLNGVVSLAKKFKKVTGATLPNSEDVETGAPKAIGPGAKDHLRTREHRPVRTTNSFEF